MIEYAIKPLLTGAAAVNAELDGRIFPLRAPKNAALPFVVYQRAVGDHRNSLAGDAGIGRITVQIDVYAETALKARQTQELIRRTLQGYQGDVSLAPFSAEVVKVRSCVCEDNPDAVQNLMSGSDKAKPRASADYSFWVDSAA